MASGGNHHADRRESTERQEAIRTMFVNLHATEHMQSPGQWRHERPNAFRVRFQTALTSASRFLSGGRHGATPPQGA